MINTQSISARTFTEAAPLLEVRDDIGLERVTDQNVPQVYGMIQDNYRFLKRFVGLRTSNDGIVHDQQGIDLSKDLQYIISYNDRSAGTINFHHKIGNTVFMGYWLIEEAQGKGLAIRSALKLRDYGRAELGLKRIMLNIRASNIPSLKVAERLGATQLKAAAWPGYQTWII
jgi:RimJ/RimL family protein N-acetyltransferase